MCPTVPHATAMSSHSTRTYVPSLHAMRSRTVSPERPSTVSPYIVTGRFARSTTTPVRAMSYNRFPS